MMIKVDGTAINSEHIVSAHVDTRHYVNGAESTLVIQMVTGVSIRRKHGFGFDAFGTLEKILGKSAKQSERG